MIKKKQIILTALVVAALLFASCGGQSSSGSSASQSGPSGTSSGSVAESGVSVSTDEPEEQTAENEEQAAENEEQTAANEEQAVNSVSESGGAGDSSGNAAEGASGSYAWLGLQDMPQCGYVDALAGAHYIHTYESYVMGLTTETTEAVDGLNTYKESAGSKVYSVDGRVVSLNESTKIYTEMDLSASIDAAKERMEAAMKSGQDTSGRSFKGTGKGAVPLYSDNGDTAEYDYYEYDYPDTEALGTSMLERFYMKDGDVFAIYQKISTEKSDLETTKVLKSYSTDIPEETFDIPDLQGYTKYE